jgi:hypothetical protein
MQANAPSTVNDADRLWRSVRLIVALLIGSGTFAGGSVQAAESVKEARMPPIRAQATETAAKQAAQQHAQAQRDAATAFAAESAKARFTLEVRGLGITVDRFRQGTVWQRIDIVNDAYQTIISQNPKDYEWGSSTRSRYFTMREGNAFKASVGSWVERWPIPVLVAGPSSRNSPALEITTGRQSGGLGACRAFTGIGDNHSQTN